MGHKEKAKTPDEWDCFSSWRKILCYLSLHSTAHKIKTKFSRRNRRKYKQFLANKKNQDTELNLEDD